MHIFLLGKQLDRFGDVDITLVAGRDPVGHLQSALQTDNGSTLAETYYPAGMRGKKTQLWEGGHRVPCFIRWPAGGLNQGRDVSGLTQAQDLLPTLLKLTGSEVDRPDFDGIDLSGMLRGEDMVDPERMLVINYSRMPQGFEYPAPDSPSIMRKEMSGVLWKRWRLLEDYW